MRSFLLLFTIFLLWSCSSVKPVAVPSTAPHEKEQSSVPEPSIKTKSALEDFFEGTETRFQDQTGFMLYDVEEKKVLHEYQADKYFTPGSNTKIFTFYTSLRILGDSVPALQYIVRNDSLIFWGTGDPSFLYKFTYNNFKVFDFLKNSPKKLYFSNSNFYSAHFGPGWAWDDYNEAFSAERSPFPVYGNLFTVQRKGSILKVQPPYFDQFLSLGERQQKEKIEREIFGNNFKFYPGLQSSRKKEWDVPMRVDQQLIVDLLTDTLKKKVYPVSIVQPPVTQPVYSILTDSLYSVLMQDSDNFIAEQLLLMCAGVVRDSLQVETAIRYSTENFLRDLPDKPIWVDASGLSRYNLFTPRTIVEIWHRIYDLVPRERLFQLLATGGVNGTIKKWYKNERPYIFGKTGTLSNNHALSGFLVAKSGKVLIFTFMNNNYVATTNDIRANMQELLYKIYEQY